MPFFGAKVNSKFFKGSNLHKFDGGSMAIRRIAYK